MLLVAGIRFIFYEDVLYHIYQVTLCESLARSPASSPKQSFVSFLTDSTVVDTLPDTVSL